MPEHHLRPVHGTDPVVISASPEVVGWRYLDFSVIELDAHQLFEVDHVGREVAVVALSGIVQARAGAENFELSRSSVFEQQPHVLYVPPGTPLTLEGVAGRSRCAVGGAPAEGRYPTRLFSPSEMRIELRGGGAARRQVGHILSHPLPAERLILYEVLVPRGTWSGWPPHCHDGYDGSPYLEETYYFELQPADGFVLHRNYRLDEDFDELFTAHHGDVVAVTKGYHSSVACPGSNMFFLNFLAGDLLDEERARPPCFDGRYTWILDDWESGALDLTITRADASGAA